MAYTDSFTGTDATQLSTHNSNWSDRAECQLSGNKLITTAGGKTAYYSGGTFAQDQYSQAVMTGIDGSGSKQSGLIVRLSTEGTNYYCLVDTTRVRIYKSVGYSVSLLSDTTSLSIAAGSTIRMEATGSTSTVLTVKDDGTTVATYTDSSSPITTGVVGIYLIDTGVSYDDWEGGDVGAGPSASAALLLGNYYRN